MSSGKELAYKLETNGIALETFYHNKKEEVHFYVEAPKEGEKIAVNSFWQQDFPLHTFSQHAPMIQNFSCVDGNNYTAEAVKVNDFIFNVATHIEKPGLRVDPDSQIKDNIIAVHYIQGCGIHMEKERSFKMSNITLFKDDSHQRLTFIEMSGAFHELQKQLGYKETRDELIAEAQSDSVCTVPWVGNFPFNFVRSSAFNIGSVGNYKLNFNITLRQPSEYISLVFKEGVKPMWSVPKVISLKNPDINGKSFKNSCLGLKLVSNHAQVSDWEKNLTHNNYRQIMFRSFKKIGETTIDTKTVRKVESIGCDMDGMAQQVILTVAPHEESGIDYQETCNVDGTDFINSANLMLNGKPVSDSLPAEYMRTQMWMDSWGRVPSRYQYVLNNFAHVPASPYFSGGLLMTPFTGMSVDVDLKPHAVSLKARVDCFCWMGWYTSEGVCYILWP